CKRTQMRFSDYSAKVSSLMATVPRGVGYPRSVAATFDLALTQAAGRSENAEVLMTYLAYCAPDLIPMALLNAALRDDAELPDALAALSEVSLIKHATFEDCTPAVTVHRLMQAAARGRSELKGVARDTVVRLNEQLLANYPQEEDAFSNP